MEDKSYFSFFGALQTDIEGVNNFTAHYNNMICYTKNKYTTSTEEMEIEDKTQIKNITQSIRFYATKVFTKLSALKHKIKEVKENYETLETSFRDISNESVPEFEKVLGFSIELNKILVDSVLSDMLMKSSEYMKQYSDTSEGQKNLPSLDQF